MHPAFFLQPTPSGWAPTEALHGSVQSLGILAGIKVWEVSNGTAVLGTLWTEKAEDELLTLALNGAPRPIPRPYS